MWFEFEWPGGNRLARLNYLAWIQTTVTNALPRCAQAAEVESRLHLAADTNRFRHQTSLFLGRADAPLALGWEATPAD